MKTKVLGESMKPDITSMESRYCLDALVTRSRVMRDLVDTMIPLCVGQEPVIISGQKGAGKSLIARVLHGESMRSERAFITVRANMLSLDTVDKILFGDLTTGHVGKLDEANGGTLLIENVEQLSAIAQERFLSVLSAGTFTNCFGETKPFDCRVMATANDEDLDDLVDKGSFSEELLKLISAKSVHVPSLSERKEDVPYLVVEFLNDFAMRERIQTPTVPYHYMELLMKVPWTGNAKQLRNHLESVMVLSKGKFSPALIMEHFEEQAAPVTIKSTVQNLWNRLRHAQPTVAVNTNE